MTTALQPAARAKSPEAFRSIGEAADELNVPQHVLRFWEMRFNQIRPIKRAGGRRFYRPEDVDLLRGIRVLLYFEGYTIKGVQKVLRERGVRHVVEIGRNDAATAGAEDIAPGTAIPEDIADAALATLARVRAEAEQILNEEARMRLEILLAELLQLKSRLQTARAKIG